MYLGILTDSKRSFLLHKIYYIYNNIKNLEEKMSFYQSSTGPEIQNNT